MKLFKFLLFCAVSIASISLKAQDTVRLQLPDTLQVTGYTGSLPAVKPRPFLKSAMTLVPITMIGYGVLSLGNDQLQSINRDMKEEIWTDRQPKKLSIDNYLQWMPVLSVYGLNAAGIKGEHNFRDRTIIYGMAMGIMSGAVFTTKHLSKQFRPDDSNNQSFPSGHTANAFVGAEFLRREYKDVSPWYGIAGYAVAGFTGYLRMYNNRHWLSDVVAGAGIGILSTDLSYYLYPKIRKIFKEKKQDTVVMPFYNGSAAGLTLVRQF